MEIIDNIHKTWCADLSNTIKQGSKVSIAASCFSIYAFQEFKKTLEGIEELRFLFTSTTFISDKSDKQKREFYIPRLHRERSLQVQSLKSNYYANWICSCPDTRFIS